MEHQRVHHWEEILQTAFSAAGERPFVWGHHDCATWAFDLRRDLTLGPDHAALWRGRYSTPIGSQRILRKLGWQNFEDGARALLGKPLADQRFARRGDLVLGGTPEAFGIVFGAKAAFLAPKGLVYLQISACRLAWRT